MGFTTVVEPAVSPHYALHAHLELADTPIIDKAILTILGNDDYLLGLLQAEEGDAADRRLRGVDTRNVARARHQGGQCRRRCGFQRQCAFVFTRRHRAVLRVSSRTIVKALQRAVDARAFRIRCTCIATISDLPGNVETALTTIAAAEGLPLHLAHLQFYGYGKEGDRGFSSAAAVTGRGCERAQDVTIDVGQVMFGQTVTISSDVLRQFNARGSARARKNG